LAKNFNKPEKNNYWLIFLIAVNFMLTFSRGIYFAGIITLIVSAILALKYSDYIKISKNILVISLGVITGILLLIGSSFYKNSNFSQIDKAKEHATEINEDSISVSERKDTWENAIVAFREKPLLGVGIGNFGPWEVGFPKEVPKGGWNIVNNETLEILAETGIIGFLALMSFLFYVFIQSASVFFSSSDKDLRIWAAGIVTAFIGVAVQYQTFSTLYIMHVWVLIGLMMSVTRLEKVNNN
jgi:O-antigen ligase